MSAARNEGDGDGSERDGMPMLYELRDGHAAAGVASRTARDVSRPQPVTASPGMALAPRRG